MMTAAAAADEDETDRPTEGRRKQRQRLNSRPRLAPSLLLCRRRSARMRRRVANV